MGEKLFQEFRDSRIVFKKKMLFDKITKEVIKKEKNHDQPTKDLNKESMVLLRSVDIARARCYDVKTLLSYEITSTSFFLSKNGFLRPASNKSDLLKKTRLSQYPLKEFSHNSKLGVFIDFMAYARKLGSRANNNKSSIKTFGDFVENLWQSFLTYSRSSQRIDIIFDNYISSSLKAWERERRTKGNLAVITKINHIDQPLPPLSELPKFWASIDNKISLQQFFIDWLIEKYNSEKPLYLGGCHKNNKIYHCYRLCSGNFTEVRLLYCEHEEADDRLQYHISHAVKVDGIDIALVCSGDTDVHTSLLYNFEYQWKQYGLRELWFQHNEQISPVHESATALGRSLVNILPAIHALTGSDTTSKVSTKEKAFKIASHEKHQTQLADFGDNDLTTEMIRYAEEFLLECIGNKESISMGIETFDLLRHFVFHSKDKKDFDVEKLPCTSETIKLHIKRAFLQTHKWKYSAIIENISLSPLNYGYQLDDDTELVVPQITYKENIPSDFPQPCTCLKCARANVCLCRINNIACCDFCKCRSRCKYTSNI